MKAVKKLKYLVVILCVLCVHSSASSAVSAFSRNFLLPVTNVVEQKSYSINKSFPQDSIPQNDSAVADSVVNYAKIFLGVPYVWAGCSSSGFDCSGYVYFVFKRFGYKIERSSDGLNKAGIPIPLAEASKGDLIVFTGTDPTDRTVGHVGIVVSEKGQPLHFIHASSSKKHPGVVITDYTNSNYPQRFVGIRRLLHELGGK